MAIRSLPTTHSLQDLQSTMVSNFFKKDALSVENSENAIKGSKTLNAKSLMVSYTVEFQMRVDIAVSVNFGGQSSVIGGLKNALNHPKHLNQILDNLDLDSIGYRGKPLSRLTLEEVKGLIDDEGFFGVAKTSERIAEFVLAGAGNDVEKLKAGREGILRGYAQAEKAWGDVLPEISQKTLSKTLERIDQKLASLGVNVLDANHGA